MVYRTGLDLFIAEQYELVKAKRVGLVTNHTGLDRNLQSNIDLLQQHPEIKLVALYGPEHGVRGNVQAGVKVGHNIDQYTGLPVYSLYGREKKPTAEILAGVDVLIFDLQDIGLRFYTYISTLFYCLESCAENELDLIVLDRLNPLGRRVEGNLVNPAYQSFIGLYPIPQRHGMTAGELARWANQQYGLGARLAVVELEGWQGEYFDHLDLQWIPPSPNIPQFKTALLYPVTCLFEGTNISEGRGTANPFEYIGAPWIDPYRLCDYLRERELPGVKLRPVFFAPTFSKHKDKECGGVQLLLENRDEVDSFLTGLTILQAIFELYPAESNWLIPANQQHKYFFDLLMGSDQVRIGLAEGRAVADIMDNWCREREDFIANSRKYILY